MIYLELFFAFLRVGLFSIGGGQAALPLIQQIITEESRWLTAEQFADIVTIAESTPGPIAINAATFTGIQVGGIFGAICATVGFLFPTVLIVLLLSLIYDKFKKSKYVDAAFKGLRPAVIGMIAAAALSIGLLCFFANGVISLENVNLIGIFLCALAFISVRLFKVNPIWVILASGAVGGILYTVF